MLFSLNVMKKIAKQFRVYSIGANFGSNLENDSWLTLERAGYRNAFVDTANIGNTFVNVNKFSSEYDAFVIGSKHSFEYFSDSYLFKLVVSPPDRDTHIAIVESKLNFRLLNDWVSGDNTQGSNYLFFNPEADQIYTKILIMNGGKETEAFIKNLSSNEDIEQYREVKAALLKAKINVFYKLWATGEMFSEVMQQLDELLKHSEERKSEVNALMKDNEKIMNDNEQIKASLNLIKKSLNL